MHESSLKAVCFLSARTCAARRLGLALALLFSLGLGAGELAHGQQPPAADAAPPSDGITRMKEVKVERITPDQLPQGRLDEDPRRVVYQAKRLPRPATEQDLKRLKAVLAPRVVEIIAVRMPAQPYRQEPMYARGHAVWVSSLAEGQSPVLVSTLDWLHDAREIYMVPPHMQDTSDAQLTRSTIVPFAQASAERLSARFLAERERYLPLTLKQPDKWRNLTTLEGAQGLPERGLKLMALEDTPLGLLYGYSPLAGAGVVAATLLQSPAKEEALSYYWQTTFQAVLGAPLVDEQGDVIVLNALRHPTQPGLSLAIPAGALRHHVRMAQGLPADPKAASPSP